MAVCPASLLRSAEPGQETGAEPLGSDSFDLVIVRKEGPRMGVSLMWAGGIGWPGVRGCGNSLADSCKG